jgi:hypothetical protein
MFAGIESLLFDLAAVLFKEWMEFCYKLIPANRPPQKLEMQMR